MTKFSGYVKAGFARCRTCGAVVPRLMIPHHKKHECRAALATLTAEKEKLALMNQTKTVH